MESDKVTIKIPRPLYKKLQGIVSDTGFDSVTDFIVFCLRDIVTAKKNDEGVKERLRNLGYDIWYDRNPHTKSVGLLPS